MHNLYLSNKFVTKSRVELKNNNNNISVGLKVCRKKVSFMSSAGNSMLFSPLSPSLLLCFIYKWSGDYPQTYISFCYSISILHFQRTTEHVSVFIFLYLYPDFSHTLYGLCSSNVRVKVRTYLPVIYLTRLSGYVLHLVHDLTKEKPCVFSNISCIGILVFISC
jgi:hypothetical protein